MFRSAFWWRQVQRPQTGALRYRGTTLRPDGCEVVAVPPPAPHTAQNIAPPVITQPVPFVAPGDVVSFRATDVKQATTAPAGISISLDFKVLTAGAAAKQQRWVCPHQRSCPQCPWIHLRAAAATAAKRDRIASELRSLPVQQAAAASLLEAASIVGSRDDELLAGARHLRFFFARNAGTGEPVLHQRAGLGSQSKGAPASASVARSNPWVAAPDGAVTAGDEHSRNAVVEATSECAVAPLAVRRVVAAVRDWVVRDSIDIAGLHRLDCLWCAHSRSLLVSLAVWAAPSDPSRPESAAHALRSEVDAIGVPTPREATLSSAVAKATAFPVVEGSVALELVVTPRGPGVHKSKWRDGADATNKVQHQLLLGEDSFLRERIPVMWGSAVKEVSTFSLPSRVDAVFRHSAAPSLVLSVLLSVAFDGVSNSSDSCVAVDMPCGSGMITEALSCVARFALGVDNSLVAINVAERCRAETSALRSRGTAATATKTAFVLPEMLKTTLAGEFGVPVCSGDPRGSSPQRHVNLFVYHPTHVPDDAVPDDEGAMQRTAMYVLAVYQPSRLVLLLSSERHLVSTLDWMNPNGQFYTLDSVVPLDTDPWSHRVTVVAVLSRKNAAKAQRGAVV